DHNDAVTRVDDPLVAFVEVLPGIADLSYRAPHASSALVDGRVENTARRVHADVRRAQSEQAVRGRAAAVRLAKQVEASAHELHVFARHRLVRNANRFEGLSVVEVPLLPNDLALLEVVDAGGIEARLDAAGSTTNVPVQARYDLVASLEQLPENDLVVP